MVLARVTVEILGAVPIAEVEVSTSVERPGRSVELLAGELRAQGRAVLRARAWRVLGSPVGTEPEPPVALPEQADPPPPQLGESFGYANAVEWRWARGGWTDRGPATVWTRMRIPVVEGEEPTPRQRVMVVADSGNGASNVLDWARYLFINTELTVHFLREPVGEWVLLDARTRARRGRRGARDVGAQRPLRDRWLAARRRCSSRHAELVASAARQRLRLRFRPWAWAWAGRRSVRARRRASTEQHDRARRVVDHPALLVADRVRGRGGRPSRATTSMSMPGQRRLIHRDRLGLAGLRDRVHLIRCGPRRSVGVVEQGLRGLALGERRPSAPGPPRARRPRGPGSVERRRRG